MLITIGLLKIKSSGLVDLIFSVLRQTILFLEKINTKVVELQLNYFIIDTETGIHISR